MGVFSEMDLERKADGNQTAQPVSKDDEILAKVQERDDARQQAEAEAAQAVLEQLAQAESKANAKKSAEESEAQKRKAHEEAEAKRKAEWEARKKAREEEELFAWESAVALEDDALVAASMKRLGDDAERLTRRNMKQCVTEYVQTLCLEDLDFARQAMHPRKTMIRCFRYINRKARDFVKQENGPPRCKIPGKDCLLRIDVQDQCLPAVNIMDGRTHHILHLFSAEKTVVQIKPPARIGKLTQNPFLHYAAPPVMENRSICPSVSFEAFCSLSSDFFGSGFFFSAFFLDLGAALPVYGFGTNFSSFSLSSSASISQKYSFAH